MKQKKGKTRAGSAMWTLAFGLLMAAAVVGATSVTAYADSQLAQDTSGAAQEIFKDIRAVATPIAAVSVAASLVVSFFSHNQRTVDMSRQIAKGAFITWCVIMILGSIFAYGKDIIDNFKGNDTLPSVTRSVPDTDGQTDTRGGSYAVAVSLQGLPGLP